MDNVIQNIKIEDIVPNNYHHQYEMKELEDLASSIKKHGLLEPITLRKKENKYELILGNKRYLASMKAGLKTIPAIIKKIDDNQVKEYLTINNDYIVLNDISLSNSIKNNLDVINLSKLNEEYERDDLKMNTNQIENNNAMQQTNNMTQQNEPTFGGRFFPSLEDEPTNMNFSNNNFVPQNPAPSQNNNFIDLTDLNINTTPNTMTQNNTVESQPINNMTQSNFDNFSSTNLVDNSSNLNNQQITQPLMNENNNIINLESLKQNPEMGTQPINSGINIDSNFQEVINDFNPNNNMIPNQVEQMTSTMEQPLNVEPLIEQSYTIEPTPNFSVNEPQPITNQEFIQPNLGASIPEPIAPTPNIGPIIPQQSIESTPLESSQQLEQKDVLPVINTLKALAVNLETFGYTIRIIDEDTSSSYKITIEVDK